MEQLRSLDLAGAIRLPVGLWVDGTRRRDALLRGLSGRDEERIADASGWPSPAARVSALLAAVLAGIGGLAPVSLEHVRSLTILDRDILLVFLRRRLFGDRILTTVACPNGSCGKLVDIDFNLGDLPLPERSDSAPRYSLTIDGQPVSYRLPDGSDQEAAAEAARSDTNLAARLILERCCEPFDGLTPDQAAKLADEMSRRDAQLDTDFDARCPECGSEFTVRFDIQDFLLGELSTAGSQLYRQVHTLAWYYHWSEAEIMTMPMQKRRMYLKLISDVVSEAEEAFA